MVAVAKICYCVENVTDYHDGPMVEAMRANSADGQELWRDWRAYMVSLANSRGIYGDTAEELAQDAYLQTERALANFRFGSRLKTYFCGIFLNCYRHWARSNKSPGAREEELTPLIENENAEEQVPRLVDSTPSTQGGSRRTSTQRRDCTAGAGGNYQIFCATCSRSIFIVDAEVPCHPLSGIAGISVHLPRGIAPARSYIGNAQTSPARVCPSTHLTLNSVPGPSFGSSRRAMATPRCR